MEFLQNNQIHSSSVCIYYNSMILSAICIVSTLAFIVNQRTHIYANVQRIGIER